MKPRLKWYRGWLRLGRLALGRIGRGPQGFFFRVSVPSSFNDDASSVKSRPYEHERDARKDCVASVRALLCSAGVAVGP